VFVCGCDVHTWTVRAGTCIGSWFHLIKNEQLTLIITVTSRRSCILSLLKYYQLKISNCWKRTSFYSLLESETKLTIVHQILIVCYGIENIVGLVSQGNCSYWWRVFCNFKSWQVTIIYSCDRLISSGRSFINRCSLSNLCCQC